MNMTRFGLRRVPFVPSPDVRNYVPLATHDAAVTAVTRSLRDGGSLALVDGGTGCGKTITALRFASQLSANQPCVVIPAAKFATPADLLQAVLFDLGTDYRGLTETELRLAVTDRLLANLPDGPTVIVVDESQHLSDDVLEEVRMLGNLTGRGGPAAFVLLVAQPALRARLATVALGSVADRVAVWSKIDPLGRDESVRFLRDQLTAAGGQADELLDDEAAGVLADHGKGSPRLLNKLGLTSLAVAAEGEADAVDVEVALEAVSRLGLVEDGSQPLLRLKTVAGKPGRARKRKSA